MIKTVKWTPQAKEEYDSWSKDDKTIQRIKALITNIKQTPYSGIGKPEPLKYSLSGWWSRRITQQHRLVYRVEQDTLIIKSCRFHY